jgi:hypothetical protein
VLPLSVVGNSRECSPDKLDNESISGYPYGLLNRIRQTVRTPYAPKAAQPTDLPDPVHPVDLVDSTVRRFRDGSRDFKAETETQTAPPDTR